MWVVKTVDKTAVWMEMSTVGQWASTMVDETAAWKG
jgi:hypothetical protein